MGNCIRRCFEDDSDSDRVSASGHRPGSRPGYRHGGQAQSGPYYPRPPAPGSVTYNIVGFTAVARDLLEFETTNKVPGALSNYVSASKATQIIWYQKLLVAWKRANPPPATAEAVAVLLIQTLQGYHNIQDLLDFYRLPCRKITVPTGQPVPEVIEPEAAGGTRPEKVEFEIRTLPVEEATVGDGDGFTVFVNVHGDARETKNLPTEIKDAVKRRRNALAQKEHQIAHALQKQIEGGDYKVFDAKGDGVQCLARKYRIRLMGVDAPEIGQRYGQEAKVKLRNLVKGRRLLIHVYTIDQYRRAVGDVHCNGVFIQEVLLKEGLVWHYKHYDKREDFAKWERDARAARLGLWADNDPEEPWNYRYKKKHPNKKYGKGGRSFQKRGA